jgi:hypothetical protein
MGAQVPSDVVASGAKSHVNGAARSGGVKD